MGYAALVAPCIRCGTIFASNPRWVPSMRLTPDGEKEPVCRYCYDRLNRTRVLMGLEPWPEPHAQAYEAIAEEEL